MKRLALVVIAFLLVTGGSTTAWLLYTEQGLRLALSYLSAQLPGKLHVTGLTGKLAGIIKTESIGYRQENFELQVDAMELDWRIWDLITGNIYLQRLTAAKLSITQNPSAAAKITELTSMPPLTAPLRLQVEDLRLTEIVWLASPTSPPVKVYQLKTRMEWFQDILQVRELRFNYEHAEFNGSGTATMSGRMPVNAQIRWRWQQDISWQNHTGTGTLAGDLDRVSLSLQLLGQTSGHILLVAQKLDQQPDWRLAANFDGIPRDLLTTLPVDATISAVTVNASGDTQNIQGRGTFNAAQPGKDTLQGSWRATMRGNVLQLQEFVLRANNQPGNLSAKGSFSFTDNFQFDAVANWQQLPWLSIRGVYSEQGRLHLTGTKDSYRTDFFCKIAGNNLPASEWTGVGNGDTRGLHLQKIAGRVLGGSVTGNADIQYLPSLQWRAKLRAVNIDAAEYWPGWHSRIKARIILSGLQDNEDFRFEGAVNGLTGTLQNAPITGAANATVVNNRWQLHKLSLESGESKLSVSGDLNNDNIGLQWQAESPDLSALHRQAKGSIHSSGTLSGTRQKPALTMTTTGRNLQFQSYQADRIDINLDVNPAGRKDVNATADITGLRFSEHALESLNFNATGSLEKHQIRLNMRRGGQSLTATASAGFIDDWRGRLTALQLNSNGMGEWQLINDAQWLVSAERIQADKLCLQTGTTMACLNRGNWQPQTFNFDFSVTDVPVAWLQAYFPENLTPDGSVSGNISLLKQAQELTQLQAEAKITAGKLTWHSGNNTIPLQLDIDSASLKLAGALPGTLESHIAIDLPNHDRMNLQLRFAQLPSLPFDVREQAVNGQYRIALSELNWLEALIPEIDSVEGNIELQGKIAGTLQQPLLSANLNSNFTTLSLPRIGIKLSQVTLQLAEAKANRLFISGAAHSGKGAVNLTGLIDFTNLQSWRTELNFSGENFEVAHIPEARLVISPQMTLRIAPGTIHVEGAIDIPEARIEPRDIRQATLPSADVVIIGREVPQTALDKWSITGKLRISADDSIRFTGYDYDGRIGGQLTVIEDATGPTRASGELHGVVGATYKAFGRKLTVEQGKLLFADTPLDDPALDITATRAVGEITTGVKVSGTARAPVLQLFSRPPMDETDILSYMTLGRPINDANRSDGATLSRAAQTAGLTGGDYLVQSIGQQFGLEEARIEKRTTSDQPWLVLGTFLSPRLYVRYGVGLYEAGHTVLMRYRLVKHWQLQGETGDSGGIDLLYSREKP